ncbi:hypothetical protein AYO08_06250 [Pseudomonas putida]|uniref:hypothetical protein n=1 Tax=Pseudomonas putida TaxID=303 RepID=UPI0007DC1AB2|nr:hypothetical protein [Pseudomonas putida]OAS12335.1 hypothetical protein AYO08_06250 [Pseudomonas putida]
MKRLLEANTVLPQQFHDAYKFCLAAHDIVAQLLVSGMKQGIFVTNLTFNDEKDLVNLEQADDLIDWLKKSGRMNDEADVLVTTAFPAVLSDMLHCIFEALEASRKGKLAIAYMLLRKPFQESLYLLESVVADKASFAKMIAEDPARLRPQNAGGIDGHTRRIEKVLEVIGEASRLDANYIARLRYDKTSRDSFDSICNKAMHLFTDHKAIRTESYNINFIFSQGDQVLTQWAYLYSRLPYLMTYIVCLVEYIAERFAQTHPTYTQDMNRRLAALLLKSNAQITEGYQAEQLSHLAEMTYCWLSNHCLENGFPLPTAEDLSRMASSGAFPGEQEEGVVSRELLYQKLASQ